MSGTATRKIRLGVIGLGRLWEVRHRPALARLRDRFEVTALYHQVARRAEIEARQLGCRASDGLSDLITSPDVDALAWLAPQWFGAYPVELAAQAGKPIYCGVPLPDDAAGLDRLERLGGTRRPTLMVEFAPRCYPATVRLREWLRTRNATIQAITIEVNLLRPHPARSPGPHGQGVPGSILTDPGQSFVDVCRCLTGSEVSIASAHPRGPAGGIAHEATRYSCSLELGAAVRASLTIGLEEQPPGRMDAIVPGPARLTAQCDSGEEILVEWPDRFVVPGEILDPGRAAVPPSGPPIGDVLFDQFYRLIRGLDHWAPTWDDALAAARAVALIRRGGASADLWVEAGPNLTEPTPGVAP